MLGGAPSARRANYPIPGAFSTGRGTVFEVHRPHHPSLMAAFRRLGSAAVVAFSTIVLAQAQSPQPLTPADPAAIDKPLVGTTEVLDELRAVSYYRADGVRTYGIVAADVAKYFPAAVTAAPGGETIDAGAMAAVLLSLVKDLKDANAHLNSQLEHVIYDRAELERRLHALEAEVAELRAAAPAYAATDAKKSRRRGAAARN